MNKIDPLDMDQWDFFILPTSVLDDNVGDWKSVGLKSLMELNPLHVKYGDISQSVDKLAGESDMR